MAENFKFMKKELLKRAGNEPHFLNEMLLESQGAKIRRVAREEETRKAAERVATLEEALR